MTNTPAHTGYASANGLKMYYEIHGAGGKPLLLLHGAYMTIDAFGKLLPALAATRQVIAVELQGHGRTADIDRSITYEQMADDVAALLRLPCCARRPSVEATAQARTWSPTMSRHMF